MRLTEKGAVTKEALLSEHYRPPAELSGLSAGELEELVRLLGKAGRPVSDQGL